MPITSAQSNNFMATPPGHPFMEYCMSQLRKKRYESYPELKATGPEFLTVAIRNYFHMLHCGGSQSRATKDHAACHDRYSIHNSSNVTIYSQPLIYKNVWDRPKVGSCGSGLPKELRCKECQGKARTYVCGFSSV